MSIVLPFMLALTATDECPASLVLKVHGLSSGSADRAQVYADCLSQPWLPTTDGRGEKMTQCASKRPTSPDAKLAKTLTWVEKMAANFPGCETRLEIKKR